MIPSPISAAAVMNIFSIVVTYIGCQNRHPLSVRSPLNCPVTPPPWPPVPQMDEFQAKLVTIQFLVKISNIHECRTAIVETESLDYDPNTENCIRKLLNLEFMTTSVNFEFKNSFFRHYYDVSGVSCYGKENLLFKEDSRLLDSKVIFCSIFLS